MAGLVDAELLAWVGSGQRVSEPGAPCAVWRVARGWLKQYPAPRPFEQAGRALRTWAPKLGVSVPAILDERPALRARLLGHVEGEAVSTLAGAERERALAATGRALAALHALPIDDGDPVSLEQALGLRYAAARGALHRAGHPSLARLAPLLPPMPAARRVPCHRDIRPANLLWDGRCLGLIDWEHARPDLAELDLVRLEAADRAQVAGSYGSLDPHRLAVALQLHGAVSMAWGVRHGVARWTAAGVAALDELDQLDAAGAWIRG